MLVATRFVQLCDVLAASVVSDTAPHGMPLTTCLMHMQSSYGTEHDGTETRMCKKLDFEWVSSFCSGDFPKDLFSYALLPHMLSIQTQTDGETISPMTQRTWDKAEYVPYPKYGEDKGPWRQYHAKQCGIPTELVIDGKRVSIGARKIGILKENINPKENAARGEKETSKSTATAKPKDSPIPLCATAASGTVKEAPKPAQDSKTITSTVKKASDDAAMTVDKDNLLDEANEECKFVDQHFSIASFGEYSKAYFTPKQREKHPEWPENCSRCKKSFWTELKLKASNTHRFCKGALNNTCSYCFCHDCFQHKLAKGSFQYIAPPTPDEKGQTDVLQSSKPNPCDLFSRRRKRTARAPLDL